MHNLSNRRLFSRDVQLELDNLCATDSADTSKPKFGCYCTEHQTNALFLSIRLRKNARKQSFLVHISLHSD